MASLNLIHFWLFDTFRLSNRPKLSLAYSSVFQEKNGKEMRLDCIQSLLGQLWNCQCAILLGATRGQWRKASHEEVQTWERHQVHGNLAQVAIQLARETQAAGDTAHGSRHQMVQVAIRWGSQLQSAEANIV